MFFPFSACVNDSDGFLCSLLLSQLINLKWRKRENYGEIGQEGMERGKGCRRKREVEGHLHPVQM